MKKGYNFVRSRIHLPLALLISTILAWSAPSLSSAGMPVAGQPAPDFSLPGLFDEKSVSLNTLKGKVVLLNIWASWCTSCKDEMEDLMAIQEQYGPRGFSLVAVNIDNAAASAVDFLQRLESRTKKKPGFILLYDKEKKMSNDYRQRAMPTSYLIDREGIVRKIYPGSFSKSSLGTLKASIEEVLK